MGRQWQRVEIRRKGWVARDGGGDGAKLTRHNGGADGMRTGSAKSVVASLNISQLATSSESSQPLNQRVFDAKPLDQPTSDANRNKSGLINSPTQNVRQCKTPADCRT
ncbi:hypothetical protein OsI_02044 [Oryza sativa Indica Group]|uniref:Uncharacterized protein n=1 Tax=Oryza sativa subsp. indica TaxID=39946 RepID=B8A8J8_ORYSI|nr:hypothetical protein OsI_02044 [Oryza sativa Indica Group]